VPELPAGVVIQRRFDVGDTVDLYRPGEYIEAVVREVTSDGYTVSERGRLGWKVGTVHVATGWQQAGRRFVMPPAVRPRDEDQRAARVAVDRAIRDRLASMPCFCTPERPELGRKDWCAKHWLLVRLDREALAAEVRAAS
jgi:hypothetical protein